MRKISLVLLMLVGLVGTFVSCSSPTGPVPESVKKGYPSTEELMKQFEKEHGIGTQIDSDALAIEALEKQREEEMEDFYNQKNNHSSGWGNISPNRPPRR